MTKAYVQEYAGLAATQQGDSIDRPGEPPLVSYVLDYGAGVANGPLYQPGTNYITVEPDSICAMTFNGTPATANDKHFPAAVGTPFMVCVSGVNHPSTTGSLNTTANVGRASAITAT